MKHQHTRAELEHIWHEVPPDYYQKGIRRNILQRIWHTSKLILVSKYIRSFSKNPSNILDVGSASGWFLNQIKKKFPNTKCTGVDVYKNAILYGRKKYKNIKLFNSDAHDLPFPNQSFEVIVCNEVLEHVVSPEKVLLEIKRVLKKDGIAIIEMDTGNIVFKTIWYFWTHLRRGVWHNAHIQVFNTKKLENSIKRIGFIIKKKKIFNMSMAVIFLCKKNE